MQTLKYLSQKNDIFDTDSYDLSETSIQQSLIRLILSQVYFKTNKKSFVKKANDYLQLYSLHIQDFSEFVEVNGFMKLLNAFSNNFIPSRIEAANNDDLIDQLILYLKLSNVPVIIDKTAFLPINQDFLLYQALLIIDHFESSQKKVTFSSYSNISLTNDIFNSSEIIDTPKSSYLNIFNNYMENNFLKGIKFFSDFEEGIILPKFVSVLIGENVPDIIQNPIGYDQLMNNMNCLYFVKSKFKNFNPRDFNMHKENDIINLIRILMKNFLLTNDFISKIKKECIIILHQYRIKMTNFNKDWDDGINFVALLNFLSKSEIKYPPSEKLDIDKLKNMFIKVNCQFVLENDSIFGEVDEFVVIYQIKLIFDKIIERKIEIPNISKVELSDDKSKDLNPMLLLLNLIGKEINIHYDSIDEIIDEKKLNSLMKYLIENSDNIEIKQKNIHERINLNSILNYLKENFDDFQTNSFNFNDKLNRNENIINFTKLLFKKLFLKNDEIKMLEKVSNLLGETILTQNMKQFFQFGNGFYKILDNNSTFKKKNYYDEQLLHEIFQNKKIPFI